MTNEEIALQLIQKNSWDGVKFITNDGGSDIFMTILNKGHRLALGYPQFIIVNDGAARYATKEEINHISKTF